MIVLKLKVKVGSGPRTAPPGIFCPRGRGPAADVDTLHDGTGQTPGWGWGQEGCESGNRGRRARLASQAQIKPPGPGQTGRCLNYTEQSRDRLQPGKPGVGGNKQWRSRVRITRRPRPPIQVPQRLPGRINVPGSIRLAVPGGGRDRGAIATNTRAAARDIGGTAGCCRQPKKRQQRGKHDFHPLHSFLGRPSG